MINNYIKRFFFRFIFFFLFLLPILSSSTTFKIKKDIKRKPIIVLDAGHGGKNTGAKKQYPLCEEKRLSLITTLLAKRYIEQMGYRVILTRSKDAFISLAKRVYIANKFNADLFVSIHFNSSYNRKAKGIEVYYPRKIKSNKRSSLSHRLASNILLKSIFHTKAVSRGVKEANFYVIKDTKMPAILLEGGFITNDVECRRLRQRQYLEKLAKGIAEGVGIYLKRSSSARFERTTCCLGGNRSIQLSYEDKNKAA